ncbi:MAG: hypothetical protein AAB624_01625 [Patescibacteria group bacterium]
MEYKPERADENLYKYQLIVFLDTETKLHITLKRRFGLLGGYSRKEMVSDFKNTIEAHKPFTISRGKPGRYEGGPDYYSIESTELSELLLKILRVLEGKIRTRDLDYEGIFHISIDSPEKTAVIKGQDSWLVREVWLQEGARGEVGKQTICFIMKES